MNRKYLPMVLVIFAVSFILRVIYLPQYALSFSYDQARDAFVAKELLGGDLKLLGPSVSGIPGLYHGVLYYYLLSFGYFIGNGNPLGPAILFSFINSLTVFIVFYFAFIITGNIIPAFLSAILFAFSFEATQYANWLTNATMALWFVPLTYLGLYLWINKYSGWGPVIAGLGLGFSIQSEVALGYHLLPLLYWLVIAGRKINKKEVILFLGFLAFAVLPMILAEIKFGYRGLSGLIYLFSGQDKIVQNLEFGQFLLVFLNQAGKTLSYTLFPVNVAMGGLLGTVIILNSLSLIGKDKIKKFSWQYFLLSYIFAHIFALPFGGSNMRHIMAGAAGGISIFTGIYLWKKSVNQKPAVIFAVLLIIFANLYKIISENKYGQTIFPLQTDLTVANGISAVEYTYKEAGGEKFSINTLTSPLYVNTLWSYFYSWYGFPKYGYLPSWAGKDQIGQPGNLLANDGGNTDLHFYIIEPTYGIPEQYVLYSLGEEDSKSKLLEEKSFGSIKVQKRSVLLNNKSL